MTRSRKKSPFFGISTSVSEKADKVAAHKRERRKVHTLLKVDPEAEPLPHKRELSNIWAYAKDGPRRYRKNVNPAKMRK